MFRCPKCGRSTPSPDLCSECAVSIALDGVNVCLRCGAQLKEDDEFCGNCGKLLSDEEELEAPAVLDRDVCPSCGSHVQPGNQFCGRCGKEVAVEDRTEGVCQWCTSQLPASAVRCPNCGKYRHDIERERVIYYWSILIFFTALVLFLVFMFKGAWKGEIEWQSLQQPLFSWSEFFGSMLGVWLFACFIISGLINLVYWNKLRVKLGTSWFF